MGSNTMSRCLFHLDISKRLLFKERWFLLDEMLFVLRYEVIMTLEEDT